MCCQCKNLFCGLLYENELIFQIDIQFIDSTVGVKSCHYILPKSSLHDCLCFPKKWQKMTLLYVLQSTTSTVMWQVSMEIPEASFDSSSHLLYVIISSIKGLVQQLAALRAHTTHRSKVRLIRFSLYFTDSFCHFDSRCVYSSF